MLIGTRLQTCDTVKGAQSLSPSLTPCHTCDLLESAQNWMSSDLRPAQNWMSSDLRPAQNWVSSDLRPAGECTELDVITLATCTELDVVRLATCTELDVHRCPDRSTKWRLPARPCAAQGRVAEGQASRSFKDQQRRIIYISLMAKVTGFVCVCLLLGRTLHYCSGLDATVLGTESLRVRPTDKTYNMMVGRTHTKSCHHEINVHCLLVRCTKNLPQ